MDIGYQTTRVGQLRPLPFANTRVWRGSGVGVIRHQIVSKTPAAVPVTAWVGAGLWRPWQRAAAHSGVQAEAETHGGRRRGGAGWIVVPHLGISASRTGWSPHSSSTACSCCSRNGSASRRQGGGARRASAPAAGEVSECRKATIADRSVESSLKGLMRGSCRASDDVPPAA